MFHNNFLLRLREVSHKDVKLLNVLVCFGHFIDFNHDVWPAKFLSF